MARRRARLSGMLRSLFARITRRDAPDDRRLRESARRAVEGGDLARARALLEQALALDAQSPGTLSDLGNVHLLLAEPAGAERCYLAALELAPAHASALANLGVLRARGGDRPAALDCFRRAVRADPWAEQAIRGLVEALPDDTVPREDIALMREITARFPDHAAAFSALGRLLLRGAFDAGPALAAAERAIALGHGDADTLTARGVALQELGRLEEALAAYEAARARDPGHVGARFHRAIALLTLGRFAEGWPDYELRLLSEDRPRRAFPFPRWQGDDLAGRTLLVHSEQGIGDEILFASCLPDIVRAAGHCVIECSPRLAPIFRRSFPEATVHASEQTGPVDWAVPLGIDVQAPAGSLPLHLRATTAAFPEHRGYLVADPAKVDRWRERLAALGPGRAIGISWRGGTSRTRTERRSLVLSDLAPLLREPGFHFVSLQYGPEAAKEVERFAPDSGLRVHHWPEAIDDYDETAALASALDGIVSVCTAVVHLGGALGRPVWVATPRVPEWRYGAQGARMPWYPSVRLIRQAERGVWAPVVGAIVRELRAGPPEGTASVAATIEPRDRAGSLSDRVERLLARGSAADARAAAEEAADRSPGDAQLNALCGRACLAAGDAESALDYVLLALHHDPGNERAFEVRIAALDQLGRGDEIPAACEELLGARPGHAGALLRLARAALAARDYGRAVERFGRVVEREPSNAAALNDLGLLLAREFGEFERGEALLRRALAAAPGNADAKANLAWVLCERGATEEGFRLFDEQVARAPEDHELRLMRAVARLKHGDFAGGWDEYEARFASPLATRRPYAFPPWDGTPLGEGALLVYGEQGLGDQIMFASCLPDLRRQIRDCVIECDPRLGGLFARSFPGARVVTAAQSDAAPAWLAEPGSMRGGIRAQIPIGSLPRRFRRSATEFPRHAGYLRADPARVDKWRARLAAFGANPKIGLAWRGGTASSRRSLRSLELDQLAPVLATVPATWVSLQYTDCRTEIAASARRHGVTVHHWQEAIDDYDETAALVAALDSVVTVCTAVVHLSGALGQRALVMVPYAAEWRYGAAGETMPWYPSVRLLRQPAPGAWTDLLERVKNELIAATRAL
ncbi:MAG TPA: tetratricopeptide repeat protein [Burkholderiales bacterium]|nr:tetratricopeptide repeat protein [Burkholderiales bacterium]